ncbi:iron complex transport system substrate-binding protein [Prauserella marina]|uniref:Iron complex transport system substrate-binding protein n=1 Tax=Prauserella marina TaxID=530584 RepID=A0A1G6JJB8_9PSEU|nr:ABC transporter substrate-binding protein [Prauserella marina]PWV84574.1 iron complex transport system substrate-binding protein [Prauserella marina]SDC18803.1 iron complex transport system substrate-binding protein [Prauserella marina]
MFIRARSRRFAAGVALASVVLVLAGCGSAPQPTRAARVPEGNADQTPLSELTPVADPRSYEGPSTAIVAQPDIVPVEPAPRPRLPVTVTDHQGTQVTVDDASRVLALDRSGTLAATVFGLGLGDRVVGRDSSTGFPAARDLPLVTSNGHQLNSEAVLKLRPSVVLTDTTLGPWSVVLQLRDAGIPVVVVTPRRTLDNNGDIVRAVAGALGVPEAGTELADRLDREVEAKRAEIAALAPGDETRRPRVVFLYVRGTAGVYHMFGKGSGADALISALGAVDVASEVGVNGMRPINPEALAKAKPDVILLMTGGLESVGGADGAAGIPGVAQTPAGQHRRFVDMNDYQILSFGPLSSSVLDALARALYAPDSLKAAG